ncbi:MAG: hypothetical protein ACO1N7_07230, partial [Sphingobacteriaceae bacterium]
PMVFALPGNPFSSLVTFKIFADIYIIKSLGLNQLTPLKSILKDTKPKKTSFDEFFPAKFSSTGTTLEATRLNGSGDIRLGIDADVLAIHPSGVDTLNEGQRVEYYKL